MKFTEETDEMAAEFYMVVESIKALEVVLNCPTISNHTRQEASRIKEARELERDQLEILMLDYYAFTPIELIMEYNYGTTQN